MTEAEAKQFCSASLEFKVKDGNVVFIETTVKQPHKIN